MASPTLIHHQINHPGTRGRLNDLKECLAGLMRRETTTVTGSLSLASIIRHQNAGRSGMGALHLMQFL